MAKMKFEELEDAKRHMDIIMRKAIRDAVLPYHREITAIQKDAIRLERDIQKLMVKFASIAMGLGKRTSRSRR